jgi:hypothetical protein
MKHRGNVIMETGYEVIGHALHLDELEDLDAWEGYEFWSAQLEAEQESISDEFLTAPKTAPVTVQGRPERRERKADVLPF